MTVAVNSLSEETSHRDDGGGIVGSLDPRVWDVELTSKKERYYKDDDDDAGGAENIAVPEPRSKTRVATNGGKDIKFGIEAVHARSFYSTGGERRLVPDDGDGYGGHDDRLSNNGAGGRSPSTLDLAGGRSSSIVSGTTDLDFHYNLKPYYRWYIITCYTLLALFAGPSYFNWPPYDDILHWAGAYSNQCDPSDPTYEVREHGVIFCNSMKLSIESIASQVVSVMYVFDFVAGILVDSMGPKFTALFGMAVMTFGWMFITISSANGPHLWRLGFIFLGAGTDPVLYGMLPIANVFPGWSSTAIAVLGTARSICFAVPMMLRGIWSAHRSTFTFRGISMFYMFVHVAFWIWLAIFVPWQSYPKLGFGKKLNTTKAPGLIDYKKYISRLPRIDLKAFWTSAKAQFNACKQYAFKWSYAAVVFIACAQILRSSYYSASFRTHLPNTQSFYEIMSPLSLIPCPFLGLFADHVSAAGAMAITVGSAALGMATALPKGKGWEVVSIMFNWVFNSFVSSEFYCYLAYNYPLHLYGKLAGFTLLAGGMVGFFGAPMNNYIDRTGRYVLIGLVVTALGAIAFAITIGLYYWVERHNRAIAKENRKKEQQQPAEP